MNNSTVVSSRDRILYAGKTLFARNGYENTSTVAIARQAGTSESQLMKHFGSKQGLLTAIFDLGWSGILQRVRALQASPDASPKLLIEVLATVMLELDRDPEIKTLLMLESRRFSKDSADLTVSQGFLQFSQFLESILSNLKDHGALRPGLNIKMTRAALFGMVEGITFDQIASSRNGGATYSIVTDCQKMLEAMISGLTTGAGAAVN
jgi:AcrR family transcriptional regulator